MEGPLDGWGLMGDGEGVYAEAAEGPNSFLSQHIRMQSELEMALRSQVKKRALARARLEPPLT